MAQKPGIHYRSDKNRAELVRFMQQNRDFVPMKFYLVDMRGGWDTNPQTLEVKYASFDLSECFDAWHALYDTDEGLRMACSYERFQEGDEIYTGNTFIWYVDPTPLCHECPPSPTSVGTATSP